MTGVGAGGEESTGPSIGLGGGDAPKGTGGGGGGGGTDDPGRGTRVAEGALDGTGGLLKEL